MAENNDETKEQLPGDSTESVETTDELVDSIALDKPIEPATTDTVSSDDVTSPDTPQEAEDPAAVVLSAPTLPKKSHKKLVVVLLLTLLSLLAAGAAYMFFIKKDSGDAGVPNTATVETLRLGVAPGLVEGAVEYSTDTGTTWQTIALDTDLKEGDQVRTLNDGRVVLLVDDGSAVRLTNNSSIELTSLDVANVVVTNLSGEVYSRVTASTTRTYTVAAADSSYTAKGTAYRTFNTATKKGVEVFHSSVGVDKTTDVAEGSAYFKLSDQKEKENVVSAIDLTALKKDEFMKWNQQQDKKEAEFANALGVLVEFDKPDPTPPPVVIPTPAPKSAITLSGSVSEYSANFSWKVTGVDTSQGFKLVKSKTSQTPTYPTDSAAYVEAGKTSYSLYLGDGKTYYFRICAYRGSSCESYSNTVTITTPVKPKPLVETGAVNMTISGDSASWTFAGTAPYGFKLVMSTSTSPTYQTAPLKKFTNGTSTDLPDGLVSGTTYYTRVCKYTEGDCVDYSNELTYIAP